MFFELTYTAGLIIFFSSWLIDVDHYFWFVFSGKGINPLKAMKWYFKNGASWENMPRRKRDKYKRGVFVFHSLILLVILFLLSFWIEVLFFVFLGFLIHLVADIVKLIYDEEPFYLKTFPLVTVWKNRGLKEF